MLKRYFLLVILITLFVHAICFADNSTEIAQLTDEYNRQQQIYNEASANYSNTLQQQSSWWSAYGKVIADYGDTIYIFGSLGPNGNLRELQGNVNIKIVNVNRNLIVTGVYTGLTNVVHRYIGTEEGRNGLGVPITVYILEYDWTVNNQLDSYRQATNTAKSRMNYLTEKISSLKSIDAINQQNKNAEKEGVDAYKTGIYYLDKDDAKSALIWFNKAVDAVEEQKLTGSAKTVAYYYRAWTYQHLGEYEKAANDYEKALWLDEPNLKDRNERKAKKKALKQSISDVAFPKKVPVSIVDNYLSLPVVYRQYGHVLARTQRYEEALKMLQLALDEVPWDKVDGETSYEYLLTLEMAGKKDRARSFAQYFLEPRYHSPLNDMQQIYIYRYNIQERLKELDKYDYYQPLSLNEYLSMTKYAWDLK